MYFFLPKKNVIKKPGNALATAFFLDPRGPPRIPLTPSRPVSEEKIPFFFSESLSVKGQFLNFFDVQELKDFRGTSWNMSSKSRLHFIQGHCQEKV